MKKRVRCYECEVLQDCIHETLVKQVKGTIQKKGVVSKIQKEEITIYEFIQAVEKAYDDLVKSK